MHSSKTISSNAHVLTAGDNVICQQAVGGKIVFGTFTRPGEDVGEGVIV
jgi:hypothetical protein